jgi:Na+-driven multidrug efflux pump
LVPGARWFSIGLGWGLPGIWWAAMVFVLILFVGMALMFRFGKWQRIKI